MVYLFFCAVLMLTFLSAWGQGHATKLWRVHGDRRGSVRWSFLTAFASSGVFVALAAHAFSTKTLMTTVFAVLYGVLTLIDLGIFIWRRHEA